MHCVISVLLVVPFIIIAQAGNNPGFIKAIETKAQELNDNHFEGVYLLIQKIGSGSNPTVYYSAKRGVPIFQRAAGNTGDSGKKVIVLDTTEDRLLNYKSKNTFVVLVQSEKFKSDSAYYVLYAYVRDPMPTDKENLVAIDAKKYSIEFDSFSFRDHIKRNVAHLLGHSSCTESLFAVCKDSDKKFTAIPDTKVPPDEKIHLEIEPDHKNNSNQQNNFYFDFEQISQSEKLIGEIVNFFINKTFDMNGAIDAKRMDKLIDSLERIGKLKAGVKEHIDFVQVGLHAIKSLIESTENNGGKLNPAKLINFKVLEDTIKAKGPRLAGRFNDGDYGGDYGGGNDYGDYKETKSLISLTLGRRRRSVNERTKRGVEEEVDSDINEADVDSNEKPPPKAEPQYDYKDYQMPSSNDSLRLGRSNYYHDGSFESFEKSDLTNRKQARPVRDAPAPAAAHYDKKGGVEFRTDVDLFSHLGWITADFTNSELNEGANKKQVEAVQSSLYSGYGHCPLKQVDIAAEIAKIKDASAGSEFYLQLLRMDCVPRAKDEVQSLISSDYLIFEAKDATFHISPACKALKTLKLTRKESAELAQAFEFAKFSQAIRNGDASQSQAPNKKNIPPRVKVLVKMTLDAIDDLKTLAPIHIIGIIRRLALTLKTSFVKQLQDLYRYKGCSGCPNLDLERNGALTLLSAFNFITVDMPILGATPKKTYDLFEIYFNKNEAAMNARLTNYAGAT